MKIFEQPSQKPAGIGDFIHDTNRVYISNAITAFLFSCTGPVAIIVSVGMSGGLSQTELASWIFGAFIISGLITLGFTLIYRQPIAFAWTIPGTVLLASAFDHLSYAEIIGAFWVTGILMTVVGLTGSVRKAMQAIPMPIIMGMVAGVFMQLGLDLIFAFTEELWIALAMVVGYIVVAISPQLKQNLPPIVMALVAGAVVVWLTGASTTTQQVNQWIGIPNLYWPEFSRQAIVELVIPIAITVLAVQNGQGYAVLTAASHKPPINAMTVFCGIGSLFHAIFGAVCTCVTGPSNAVLVSQGEPKGQYVGAVIYALLSIVFGFFAFGATWLMLSLPFAFVAVLGGLALFPVLQKAFVATFSSRFTLGGLVTLLVTVSDLSIWNIGAPFWGLVFGFLVSGLLEREDFRALKKEREESESQN